jgi:D-alanine-D-alanine ligase
MSRGARAYGRVAVLMGGASAEREVSLRSGAMALDALRAAGVDAHGLDVRGDALGALAGNGHWDRVFIALHGRGGEDGTLQGALETAGLPYTGSGVLGSALAMDKLRAKLVWRGAGLPTPAWQVLDGAPDPDAITGALGLPLMVKPALEGSSVGVSKVERAQELAEAYAAAAACGGPVIAETFIAGAEYTVGIVGGDVLPAVRLETPRRFYDYAAKYEADDTRYHCPCGLPGRDEGALQRLAWDAYAALDCRGWGRVDLMRDTSGRWFLIEANTVPGLTDHSLVPMAARAAGWSAPRLMLAILDSSFAQPTPALRHLRAGGAHG